ncbi:hypothetical protein ABL78_5173 [Leptomonas seymouri]|uniref:Uncharacterized protein n=1 Tax=Leptomonas seymouri TaxID=5684 RepID=A0A0N1IK20_LEPSE|nr:hypothetical protein ABL78_5173 [Leptomonas seymouri]|eukprot:KPI85755.1 hypothetical protein ABL78_5173 [Leptomonas seymouri]
MSAQIADATSSSTAVKSNDIIAFRSSLGASRCLIGVVASIPNAQLQDGTAAVLVQPRPLISVPPQPSPNPQSKKSTALRLIGELVDRSDPAVAQLAITPLPSLSIRKKDVVTNDLEASAIMTAEELQVMQEQQRSLQTDLDTSRARVKEIEELLRQSAAQKRNPPLQASPSQPATAPSVTAASPKSAEGAAKAVDAAERELLLSRAGLRTVKSIVWSDLQRRTHRKSSQLLVTLIETSVMLLHDPQSAQFDYAVQQSSTLAKRLAAVKPKDVKDDDCTKIKQFLRACPTVDAVEKEHKAAAALYRWLAAVLKSSQAHRDLQGAQRSASSPRASEAVAATHTTIPTSPGPPARDLNALTHDAESALRRERTDQLEYIQMAEEEVAALDELIAEAKALALSQSIPLSTVPGTASASHEGLQVSETVVPALTVPASWVVCVFAAADAPDMDACATKSKGTPVTFSLPASHKLVAVVRTTPTTTVAAITTRATASDTPKSGVNAQRPDDSETRRGMRDDERRCSTQSALPPTTVSSRRSSVVVVVPPQPPSPRAPAPSMKNDAAVPRPSEHLKAEPEGTSSREAELAEKARLLEARLAAALQQNPKEAELQLLRDEVNAKRMELQRVTEERDRLLLERREKTRWRNYGSPMRRKIAVNSSDDRNNSEGDGDSSPLQQPGSGRYSRQPSTPRDMVDRSIVDELEEQLTEAHQRILELQNEASQRRRRRSVSAGEPNAADTTFPSPAAPPAEGETAEVPSKAVAAGPVAARLPARTVAQEVYDELESRLQSVSTELETQRQGMQKLEEQLNSALHRRAEAESVVSAQKRELEEVWERLEVAEARAEEQRLLTEQRLLMAQAQQQNSSAQLQAPAASVAAQLASAERTLSFSPHGTAPVPPGLPRLWMPSATTDSLSDASHFFVAPSTGDTEAKSQLNDDVVTVATGATGAAYGSISRRSLEAPMGSTSVEALPTFGTGAPMQPNSVVHGGSYSRGVSASLQSRPVEQLSTIELRHEVHRLREEVERHQSGELRLSMELQTLREKQKAERKRRRDARLARTQMLLRMKDTITEVIERSNQELEAIPALLERGKEEAEALVMKRRMHR